MLTATSLAGAARARGGHDVNTCDGVVTTPAARRSGAGMLPRVEAAPLPAARPRADAASRRPDRRRRPLRPDRRCAALVGVSIVVAIIWKVVDGAWPAIEEFGLASSGTTTGTRSTNEFGARDFIIGTIVTSFGAMLLAAPLSIAIGLFLSELAPPAVRGPIGTLVEMLAAVPSVVIGLWGIYVLAPFARSTWSRSSARSSAGSRSSRTASDKVESAVFAAIVVLTIMIIPITSSICRELFIGVPTELKEGVARARSDALGDGRGVVIPSVRGGVVAAVILGLGRALGEAIAVTQVIGNFIPLQRSIFEPGDTIASRVANQYQGAVTNIQISSLIYLALILLVITFITNFARAAGRQAIRVPADGRRLMDASRSSYSRRPAGRRRRLLVNRVAEAAAIAAAALAIAVLGIVVWSVGSRGIGALNLDFFTKGPALFGESGGGIAPAIVGSLLLVAIATLIALPFGVLRAIYVSEFAPASIGGRCGSGWTS